MTAAARQAVFLDRDGVLNRAIVREGKPYPPALLTELHILPGTADALAVLQAAGFLLIGITNQPDVARGSQRREVVEAINAVLLAALPLTEILVCYHDDRDGCACRKPKPGLLTHAAQRDGIALSDSFMVGDRFRDIEAGDSAGCRSVLMGDGSGEEFKVQPDVTVRTLSEAADWILKQPVTKQD